tara:strand:- start:512 stop:745 length:234 start_codon:yes stop_codon:yes gene_type:complete
MILSKKQIKQLKNKEKEFILHNSDDGEGDLFLLWFNSKWNLFVLEKNAKVIKSTKTLQPILTKLQLDGVLTELTETI